MDEFCAKTSVGGSSERATVQEHVYKHLHVCVCVACMRVRACGICFCFSVASQYGQIFANLMCVHASVFVFLCVWTGFYKFDTHWCVSVCVCVTLVSLVRL